MSTYAIYRNKVYRIEPDAETMSPDRTEGPPIPIPFGEEDLIVDPTDDELKELGWPDHHNRT